MSEERRHTSWQQLAAEAAAKHTAEEAAQAGKALQPVRHNRQRRCLTHDYSAPGIYHITLKAESPKAQPFGCMAGRPDASEGSAEAPHVALSAIGRMVEHELLHSITAHYPMLEVQDYVIMPEHLHFILEAHAPITSRDGKPQTLGQVIAGFKKGCNRGYWQIMDNPAGETGWHPQKGEAIGAAVVSPRGKTPSSARSGKPSLFSPGYTDVMPLRQGQLQEQRHYIRNNPRNRMLRMAHPDWLRANREGIDTALRLEALKGYLRKECRPAEATEAILADIEQQLLLDAPSEAPLPAAAAATPDQKMISCDTYGNRTLLDRSQQRLLPLVCHRKDKAIRQKQRSAFLEAAKEGAVIVSACINPDENALFKELIAAGYPVIRIEDNGFPEIYHPSEERQRLCAEGRYLIVTPWRYTYRPERESLEVAFCKAMNCMAQAISRCKDDFWK